MSQTMSVDDDNFDQMVLKADKPVLVDFWAEWCRPCHMIAPIVDELAKGYDGRIKFVKVDVDHNPKTATKYSIMSIPALLIFKNGEPITRIVGLRPKDQLQQSLEAALE